MFYDMTWLEKIIFLKQVIGGYSWLSDYETTPYLYRAMPNMSHYYNREIMEEVVGGSVAWNQLVQNGDFSDGTANWDIAAGTSTVANNICEIVATGSPYIYQPISAKASGHKVFVSFKASASDARTVSVYWGDTLKSHVPLTTAFSTYAFVATVGGGNSNFNIASNNGSAGDIFRFSSIQLTDLTLALGSTIADYVYSLEQATAGSGVAWLKEHFPKMFGQYNPYDAGSIQSVSGLVSHTTKDANDNVIGTYPLDSTLTLRGIPKLDANNNLYYDGDTYESDGTVTRKYGIVDLGTLTWGEYGSTDSITQYYTTRLDSLAAAGARMVCPKFVNVYPAGDAWTCFIVPNTSSSGRTYFRTPKDYYASTDAFKTAMDGVYLVYELATPTTETAQPFTKTQLCDSGGTEEWTLVGKNLYAPTYETGNALYEFTDTGVRVYNSTAGSYKNASFKLPISKLIGKTLTFSASAIVTSGEARALCTLRNSAGTSKGTMFELTDTSYNRSFTVPSTAEDTDYLRFTFYSTGGASDSGDVTYSNIQLELGSTATPYEPYGFNIVSVGHKSKYAEK